MTKRLCLSITLAAVAILLIAVPVLAAYYVQFVVEESNGTDYTQLAMNMALDIAGLVDAGYIDSTGLGTRVTDSGYNVLPHMLAEDRVLWVDDLAGDTSTQFILFTGQSTLESFPIICGHGGYVTVGDNATLEPGGTFAFGVIGYVDTSAGANKNIIRKTNALTLSVTGAGEITFSITGGSSLVASGIDSGEMTIMVFSDGFELWMEIDDIEEDRDTASVVPNTANDWILFENDVMPYVYYFGEWVIM